MASYVGCGVSASINLAHASAVERRRRERSGSSATYVIADTMRKKKIVQHVREENLEQRGDSSEVLRAPDDRASGEVLPVY